MAMRDDVWMRHANPISVWSRIPTIFLIILAFWSRAWIGIYFLIPVIIVLIWTWLNPRIFPKPKSTNNWASKAVFGERIFVYRTKENTKIPNHHITAAIITTCIAAVGGLILVYGLYALNPTATLTGTAIAFLGKMWFIDRMTWLFEDMKNEPKYKDWLY